MYTYPKHASVHPSPLPASLGAVQLCLSALLHVALTPDIQPAGAVELLLHNWSNGTPCVPGWIQSVSLSGRVL